MKWTWTTTREYVAFPRRLWGATMTKSHAPTTVPICVRQLILVCLLIATLYSAQAQVTEQGLARSPKVGLRIANNDGSKHRPAVLLPLLERYRPHGRSRITVAELFKRIEHDKDSVDRLWDSLEWMLPYYYMMQPGYCKPYDMEWLKTRKVEIEYAESCFGYVSLRPGSDDYHFRIYWSEHENYSATGTLAPKRSAAPRR